MRLSFLNHFSVSNIRGDMFGGLTAAIVSLPLALAFGVASGAGAEAGLYGAICVGLFAAIFGGTPTLISEPTGPMTVVMTAVLTSLIATNPENGLAMAFTVVMIAGLFQILLGLLRLGKYITLMPYSVISGFMSGIGCILIILQFAPLLGYSPMQGGVLNNLIALPSLLSKIQWPELLLGIATLFILFCYPTKLKKFFPPQLFALILGTLIVVFFMKGFDMRLVGPIELGLPSLYLPTFTPEQITKMLIDGMVLGTLGCIDALLTAVIADSLTRSEHQSNKELIGQGIGNLFSGLIGGLPGAGATMGTVVNIQTGASSAWSGVTRAVVLIVIASFAANLASYIPMTVLAAIALHVGFNILDWSFLKRAHHVSRQAALVMYLVLGLTIFVDLIVAVGIGVFLANIITIERLSRAQEKNIKVISDADDQVALSEKEKDLLERGKGKMVLLYFSGPLIFGMTRALSREHENLSSFNDIVIDLQDVPLLDPTMQLAIENTIESAITNNKRVVVVAREPKKLAESFKDHCTERHIDIYNSRYDALASFGHGETAYTNASEHLNA